MLVVFMVRDKGVILILLLILCFIWLIFENSKTVMADSTDFMRYSSGVTIYSPLNKTYNSRFLALNLTYDAGLGLHHSLNYSVDGEYEGSIPFVAKNPTELHIVNKQIGYVKLSELTEGQHHLSINVSCGLYNYHGINPPGAPFTPTFPGGSDYIATWTHMIHFTIAASIPEFLSWTLLLFMSAVLTILTIFWRQKLSKTQRRTE